jgi:hypothetical protein
VNLKLERSGPWIGVAGLCVVLWLVIVSLLFFLPLWGLLVHLVVLALFVRLLRLWAQSKPARCTWIPAYAFLAYLAINAFGVIVLGWNVR